MRYARLCLLAALALLLWGLPLAAQDDLAPQIPYTCLSGDDAFARHIEQGAFYRGRRNYTDSHEEYNCAVKLNPLSVLGYRGRGVALLEQGSYQAALADFAVAVDLTPDDPYLYNSRGWAYYRLGDYASALLNFDKAITLDPNYAIAFNNRGLVSRSTGQVEDALRDFQIAIDLDYPEPRYVPYINMGDTYAVEANDLRSATRWYLDALRVAPGQPFIHEKLGDAYAELGMWREAAYYYEQFIYLQNIGHEDLLLRVRLALVGEWLKRYAPTLVIAAILLYFAAQALLPHYRAWRQRRRA